METRTRCISFHSKQTWASHMDVIEALRYVKVAHLVLRWSSAPANHLRATLRLHKPKFTRMTTIQTRG